MLSLDDYVSCLRVAVSGLAGWQSSATNAQLPFRPLPLLTRLPSHPGGGMRTRELSAGLDEGGGPHGGGTYGGRHGTGGGGQRGGKGGGGGGGGGGQSAASALSLARRRAPTGDDVAALTLAYTTSARSVPMNSRSRIADLDLDSIEMAAFASELSMTFGTRVEVATLIGSDTDTCDDVAGAIAAAGGFVLDVTGGAPAPSRPCTNEAAHGHAPPELAACAPAARLIPVSASASPLVELAAAVTPAVTLEVRAGGSADLLGCALGDGAAVGLPPQATAANPSDNHAHLSGAGDPLDAIAHDGIAAERSVFSHDPLSASSLSDAPSPREGGSAASRDGIMDGANDGAKDGPLSNGGGPSPRDKSGPAGAPHADAASMKIELEVMRRVAERDAHASTVSSSRIALIALLRCLAVLVNFSIAGIVPFHTCLAWLLQSISCYQCMNDRESDATPTTLNLLSLLLGCDNWRDVMVQWQPATLAFVVGGFTLAVLAATVCSLAVCVCYATLLARCLAPRLSHGQRFERWDSVWVGRCLVFDSVNCLLGLVLALTHGELMPWVLRLLGAKVGRRCTITITSRELGSALPLHDMDPRLLTIGDDVLIERDTWLQTITPVDGVSFVARRIVIGDDCKVLVHSTVRGGTCLGRGCTVAILSMAQGWVPPYSIVREADVLPPDSDAAKSPAVLSACTQTTLLTAAGPSWRLKMGHLGIVAFVLLQAALGSAVAVAAHVGFFGSYHEWRRHVAGALLALPRLLVGQSGDSGMYNTAHAAAGHWVRHYPTTTVEAAGAAARRGGAPADLFSEMGVPACTPKAALAAYLNVGAIAGALGLISLFWQV